MDDRNQRQFAYLDGIDVLDDETAVTALQAAMERHKRGTLGNAGLLRFIAALTRARRDERKLNRSEPRP